MNTLRRNPQRSEKRRETLLAPQQLLLQATQRMHLVLTLRLPVIDDGGTSRSVEPATCAFGTLILPEPAQRLEKDRAGQVLGQSGIADLVGDKALEIGGIRAVHLRQPVQAILSARVVGELHSECSGSFLRLSGFSL